MNLNDFVVLPNNKAKSAKLNARNLQELQMETVTLGQESKEMEERLLQLKESMSKEKKERGHSGGFRWKSGQSVYLNSNTLTNSAKDKENRLQKLSAGKLKIRVLKDEPLTAPPQPLPPTLAPTSGLQTTRKNRLRGTICGQCEVRPAGLMCAECTENYCVGCFAKFHQKGALKLHRMIPIRTDLQTHVSTPDVISSFQKQIDHSLYPCTFSNLIPSPNFKPHPHPHHAFTSRKCDQSPEEETEDVDKPMPFYPDPSQVPVVNQGEEKKLQMTEEMKRKDEEKLPMSLLRGDYSEEESARSFQEALRQWRGEKTVAIGKPTSEGAMWIPVRPVSAIATQVDLPPDKGAEGRVSGREVGMIPVMVEFKENSLTYMDRLLLKKHRRTPVEPYHTSLGFTKGLKSLSNTNSEEETANILTVQEEDFRHYYASLFAVCISGSRADPQITTPESCLAVEVLDEKNRDINGVDVQMTEDDKKVFSVQQISSKGRTLVPQTTLTSAMLSKSKPSACPTAETQRTSKISIKTPTSKSQKTNFSPTAHISKAGQGSLQNLSPHSLPLFQTEFAKFSPSCSHNDPPVQKGSDSSMLPEQPQTSQSFPELISSTKLPQLPPTNLEFPTQFQQTLCVPECLLSGDKLERPLSLVSSRPNPQPKPLERSPPVNTPSVLFVFNESPSDTYSRNKVVSTYGDAPTCMPYTSISGDYESTLSYQDPQRIPSHVLNVIQNPPSAVKDELSVDGEDEISSDCLGLAPHVGDSSDEESQMHRHIKRGRSREEEQGNTATSHLGDSFVPADAEQEEEFHTDEPEQLSEPSMVLHSQSAGSGSELLCDLHEFTPLGLDMNSGHSDTLEHTHTDPLHTWQTSLQDSDQTRSEALRTGSSLSTYSEENLVFNMTKENHTQQIISTKGEEMSANELEASGSNRSGTPTATLSHLPKSTSSPLPASALSSLSHSLCPPFSVCLSNPIFGSELVPAFRPLSQAAQEIMEICNVDHTGCEDPDLDTDTTARTLHSLEEELMLLAKETGAQASVFGVGNSGSRDERGNQHLTQGRVSENQKEEEEAAQTDLQSVLLLS